MQNQTLFPKQQQQLSLYFLHETLQMTQKWPKEKEQTHPENK